MVLLLVPLVKVSALRSGLTGPCISRTQLSQRGHTELEMLKNENSLEKILDQRVSFMRWLGSAPPPTKDYCGVRASSQ